jgi:hypothetical protein
MIEHVFFYLAFCFILTHEMDAVRLKEWRMLPFLSRLNENTGYVVFTALHVPLYLLLLLGLFRDIDGGINRALVISLDSFFVIHIFLHLILMRHDFNQFKSLFSWVLILGAGIFGLLDLFVGA